MFEKEEQKLLSIKREVEDRQLPTALDDAIRIGMMKAKTEQKKSKAMKWSSLVASILLIVMITSIRVSPTFAGFVSQIPGMKGIVELIHDDKGLSSAIENDYYVELNVTDTQNGLGFTVDGMVIDESRMVIFYSVENYKNIDLAKITEVTLLDEVGNKGLNSAYSYGGFHDELMKNGNAQGRIDISFSEETIIPELLTLQAAILLEDANGNKITSENKYWQIEIPINKSQFLGLKKEYKLEKTVSFAGQQITFNNVTVFPTRMEIEVKAAEENPMKLFSFEDLKITNETGETWNVPKNGVVASQIRKNEWKLYLESNYFHEAKELYLEAASIRALPQEESEVIVDIKKKTVIKGPTQLNLNELIVSNNRFEFEFTLETPSEKDKSMHFGIFSSTMFDETGKEYRDADGVGSWKENETRQYIKFTVNNIEGDFLHLTLTDFPTRITDEIKIKLTE